MVGNSLYVGGWFTTVASQPAGHITKLDAATGAVDPVFAANAGSGFDDFVLDIAATSSAVYVVGRFDTYDDVTIQPDLAKLSPDGRLDSSFRAGTGSGFYLFDDVRAVLATNDSVYVGGGFETFDDLPTPVSLIKLDLAGNVDETFRQNLGAGLTGGGVQTMAMSAGRLVVLNLDGSIDQTFTNNAMPGLGPAAGYGFTDALAIIATTCSWAVTSIRLPGQRCRMSSSGCTRTAPRISPSTPTSVVVSVAATSVSSPCRKMGSGWAAGSIFFDDEVAGGMTKLLLGGARDPEYFSNAGSGFHGGVDALSVIAGQVYVGGGFYGFQDQSRAALARMDRAGHVDDFFHGNGDRD